MILETNLSVPSHSQRRRMSQSASLGDDRSTEVSRARGRAQALSEGKFHDLPVVRYDPKARERSLDMLRWGLVPFWATDMNVGFANINAKAEGIETRPAFREAFQRRHHRRVGPPGLRSGSGRRSAAPIQKPRWADHYPHWLR